MMAFNTSFNLTQEPHDGNAYGFNTSNRTETKTQQE